MCSRWIIAALLVIVPLTSPNAQQSPSDTRQQIEQLARTFSERYNKQDAAAIAGMFTDDAVRVSSGVGAVNIGPQAIEESFKTQFMLGFNRIDRVIDQVSSLGTDAAIAIGIYQVSGLRQSGPLKMEGHWTEIYVRERGVWKIRLLTLLPKTAPNAVVAAMPASSDAGLEPKALRMAAIVAETKNGAETKNSAEAKSTVEVKNTADAKSTVEVKNTADAKSTVEVKNIADAKGGAETKSTLEVKNTADGKNAAEAKSNVEAKSTVELKNTVDPKNGADAKNTAEAKSSVDLKSTVDVKNLTLAKNSTETKSGTEVKNSVDAKNSVDGKKSILINIDKEKQEMTVSIDGVQTYDWPVSTGRGGYSTPTGTYTATSMNEIWYSRQWDNAPMPHAIFFMKDGHAIHGTLDVRDLGKPASHGCVRLSLANATTLFALVKQNGLQNTQVVLGGVTPGGEYKGGPASAARYYQASPAGYETGNGYYSQQQARAYYAQPQARAYYAQPQPRAYYSQSQASPGRPYYAAPQGYYAAPQGYYVMPYANQ